MFNPVGVGSNIGAKFILLLNPFRIHEDIEVCDRKKGECAGWSEKNEEESGGKGEEETKDPSLLPRSVRAKDRLYFPAGWDT